jgi:UDP-glucose 4-epimerase
MKQTVLVTGIGGYIGGQTALRLHEEGHDIIGVDRAGASEMLRGLCKEFYECDFDKIHNCDLVRKYNVDAIVHCAGSSLVGPSLLNPAIYYENNFVKTKHLLDYLVESAQTDVRVIFSSSAAIYGEPVLIPCREEDPPSPISPYGESKYMIELLLESYRRAYNISYVAFRYFNACGADPSARHGQAPGATHIIAKLLEGIRNNVEFVLYGTGYPTSDGSCVRDYVHVDDIAQAHLQAIDTGIPSGIYNLGTATGNSNKEIIDVVREVTGVDPSVSTGPGRAGDPAMLTASAEKWNQVSGWTPKYILKDMIAHAWAWYSK